MQKKKLDLNHLLAKYQGVSNTAYGSPSRDRAIDEEFYQYPSNSRTYQEPPSLPERPQIQPQHARTAHNQFSMSKSEVQAYLLSLKQEIRGEQKSLNKQVQISIKTILDNFQRNHQKLRRELLDMLDRSFAQNSRIIKEELARQSKTESPEFGLVFKRITDIDHDIDRLLNSLRGPEYKKTIAEVVTRDFAAEMNQLRGIAVSAKNSYAQTLGEVELDRTRVDAIRDNLQKLFFINRRNTMVQQQPNTHIHEIGSSIFSMGRQKAQQPAAQSRTRKSFFNFGSD